MELGIDSNLFFYRHAAPMELEISRSHVLTLSRSHALTFSHSHILTRLFSLLPPTPSPPLAHPPLLPSLPSLSPPPSPFSSPLPSTHTFNKKGPPRQPHPFFIFLFFFPIFLRD